MEILIDNRAENWEINDEIRTLIDKIIETTLFHLQEKMNYEISISFVTNEEIRELNKSYRNNDNVTDVLSFPMEEDFEFELENIMLGDIVISVDKIKEQAEEFNHSFERELGYLLVHSMLHLFGYDHIDLEDKIHMREEEKLIMDKLGIYKDISKEGKDD